MSHATRFGIVFVVVLFVSTVAPATGFAVHPPRRQTTVAILGDAFHINGQPTYAGRTFRGVKVEGLLFNSRMVQATFDDRNPETRKNWDYPDGPWDPERNTREFIAAMPAWRDAGLLGFTINFQGGSPRGYSKLNEQVLAQLRDRGGRQSPGR